VKFKVPYGTKGRIAEKAGRQINDLIQSFGQIEVTGETGTFSVKILSAAVRIGMALAMKSIDGL
jgi:hypothetical protein